MILLGLDLETSSNDPATTDIIEIGLVLWDTEQKKPVHMENHLIKDIQISPEAQAVHHISEEDTQNYGIDLQQALLNTRAMMAKADFIVAHNAHEFDKPIIDRIFQQHLQETIHIPWIDTIQDVPYPPHIKTRKLTHLAAEHNFLNPFAHRALFDVLTMLQVLSHYDITQITTLALEPTLTIVARISFDDRQKAKDRGYHWDGEKKNWYKKLKRSQAIQEKMDAGFPTVIMEEVMQQFSNLLKG